MKRIACLLSFSLILLGASHGVAAGQQLSGATGPLDGSSDPLDKVKNPKAKEKVDKAKEKVDKAKEKVDKVLPSVEEPVDDVTNEVEKSADEVVKDVGEVAKDSAGTAGPVADEPTQPWPPTPARPDIAALGFSAATELASSTNQSGTGSKDALGAEPSDFDEVVAAVNTIESAQVKGEQLAAPETDVDESEGSGLARTGAQVLAWLVLACLLMAIGATLVWRGRTG
jgi:hypothetical protein